jgi:pantetheine-phosphate adenylyltransferase
MSVALYPGSFDPIHLGHLAVVERAAREYDEVVVAVVTNPAKAGFLTSLDESTSLRQQPPISTMSDA